MATFRSCAARPRRSARSTAASRRAIACRVLPGPAPSAASVSTRPAPAGWYLDPSDSSLERWWDGTGWSDHQRPFTAAPAARAVGAYYPPGWYPDQHGVIRYWDGYTWTHDIVPPPAPASVTTTSRPPAFWCAIAAAALMVVGALGPRATATVLQVVEVNGTQGDGWLVIGAALVAAIVLFASPRDAGPVVALLAGVGGEIVGFVDLADVEARGALVAPAWGLYLVLASSAGLVIASLVLIAQRRRRAAGAAG